MDILNPSDVENAIRECSTRISNSVTECSKRYVAWKKAEHRYDVAFAAAYCDFEGPQSEKKYRAELATVEERDSRDATDAAYRYADRQSRALQDELRAWQSVGASVRSMYGVAGRGEQ